LTPSRLGSKAPCPPDENRRPLTLPPMGVSVIQNCIIYTMAKFILKELRRYGVSNEKELKRVA
jgi:hypothetical protein